MALKLKALMVGIVLLLTMASPATGDTPAPVVIETLGDSLTLGYGSSTGTGYRGELAELLDAAGMSYTMSSSATSHTGWTVQDMLAGVDGWIAADRPDLVILAIGTNNAAGVSPGMVGYPTAYQNLVAKIMADAPQAQVLLVEVGYSNASWSANQVTVNQYVIQTSWKYPGRAYLVRWDQVHACNLFDGVHPRDAGYGLMARQVYRGMAAIYGLPAIPPDAVPDNVARPGIERTPKFAC
jgi:lysophospholipase L1-like esterase